MGNSAYFGRVYADVIRNPSIPAGAKGLYAYFAVLCGAGAECFPSVATITAEMQFGEDTFRRYLKILQAAGVVSVRQEKDATGRFARNVYVLFQPSLENTVSEKNRVGKNDFSVDGKGVFPGTENPGTKDRIRYTKYTENAEHDKIRNFPERDIDYNEIQNAKLKREYAEDVEDLINSTASQVSVR